MPSHDHDQDGGAVPELSLTGESFTTATAPGITHRALTAIASLAAVGAGFVAPAVARADGSGVGTGSSTNVTTADPAGTTTTPTDTTATTTTTDTTTTPGATLTTPGDSTTVTPVPATTSDPSATATSSTISTTSTTSTTSTVPTTTVTTTTMPAPGTPTRPLGQHPITKVTGRKRAKKKHGKRPGVPLSGRTSTKTKSKKHHGKPRGRRHHNSTGGASVLQAKAKARARRKAAEGKLGKPNDTVANLTPAVSTVSSTWGGTVMANPFTSAQLARYAALVGGLTEPPKYLVRMYKAAAKRYHLPWQILAAINYIETGYGRDLRFSSAGAEGWMQFMPGTWSAYGVSVDARGLPVAGTANPWLPSDAIFSAARYLAANGARRNLPKAVYAYNHAGWYVQEVLGIAEQIDSHGLKANSKAHRKIAAMRTMARLLNGMPYVWGGGHGNWIVSSGYDCSGFVSAVLHAGGYLQSPVTTQSLPSQPSIVSGPGRYVTIFDRTYAGLDSDHVIIDIDGQWWESGGGGAAGAPSVHRIRHVDGAYLDSFNLILHPKGL